VGAGHSGLAVSRRLTERSIDHVVIERGEVANSWRTQRWDSLRLLTPNWQSRLPGYGYGDHGGRDPDGFMSMPEVVGFMSDYARLVGAPVRTGTTVTSVRSAGAGYIVDTDRGRWECKTVVLASGGFSVAKVPELGGAPPASVTALSAFDYRNPDALAPGGVLVVGASATGVQIADELHRSGRVVTVAVGEHVRMPRLYRGRDILWWMDRTGLHDERYDEVDDIKRARRVPAPQLVGKPVRTTLDLNALTEQGVHLVGRFAGIADGKAQFSGLLRNKSALADLTLGRLLDTIDEWIDDEGLDGEVEPACRFPPTRVEDSPPLTLDFAEHGIRTAIWATGFEADHSWLDLPVLDHKGRLRHDGGVVSESPGLYRIGLNFLRRRKSSFIHGAADDARDLVGHLAAAIGAPGPGKGGSA